MTEGGTSTYQAGPGGIKGCIINGHDSRSRGGGCRHSGTTWPLKSSTALYNARDSLSRSSHKFNSTRLLTVRQGDELHITGRYASELTWVHVGPRHYKH